MTTSTNGSLLTSNADLAVIRPSAPVPAEPAAPDRTSTRPGSGGRRHADGGRLP